MMKEMLYIENVTGEKSSQIEYAIRLAGAKGLRLSAIFVIPLHPDVADWPDMLEKQVNEAEAKIEILAKKTAAELEANGQSFRWKTIRSTADTLMEAIEGFMPADIALIGKLDLEPLGEKGIHNLEELSSKFHCPVLPVERLSPNDKSKGKKNILRFLAFGVLSAVSYFYFFPKIDHLNHVVFMKGTALGGLAVMLVVGLHAYIYGSFAEYLPKFIGLDKPGGGH